VVHTLGYSASGNTETDDDGLGTVRTLSYDSTDRLVTASEGTMVLGQYVHNTLGQRVSKTAGGVTTHYIYDLSGRLIAEHDGVDGSVAIEYGAIGDMLLGFVRTGVGFLSLTDHAGRPVMSVKWANGNVEWEASYRPFGELLAQSGPEAINIRFPGQFEDQETGLYYNTFRTYHPALGRYLESDPIGLRGGWNTYAYVGGNPVMRVDPRGLVMCVYVVSSGEMTCWGSGRGQSGEDLYMFSGQFASGNNLTPGCKNNPWCTGLVDVGPIPPGLWTWDPDPKNNSKPNGLRLNPSFDITPRDGGFLTHSCANPFGPSTNPNSLCSAGCITGLPDTVKRLNDFLNSDGDIDQLIVVPYPGQPTWEPQGT